MKTKTIFTPEDFPAMGQYIVRDSFPRGSKEYDFGLSVAYKIGWRSASPSNVAAIISLQDGMILEKPNVQELCDFLNSDKVGYRPLERYELVKMMELQGNRFDP